MQERERATCVPNCEDQRQRNDKRIVNCIVETKVANSKIRTQ